MVRATSEPRWYQFTPGQLSSSILGAPAIGSAGGLFTSTPPSHSIPHWACSRWLKHSTTGFLALGSSYAGRRDTVRLSTLVQEKEGNPDLREMDSYSLGLCSSGSHLPFGLDISQGLEN